jgi:hypothetical protein
MSCGRVSEGDSWMIFWLRMSLLVVLIAVRRGFSVDFWESAMVSTPRMLEAVASYAHCLREIIEENG